MAIHPIQTQQENESDIDFISRIDPRITGVLVQARRAHPSERWPEYSRLKRMAQTMVGFGASHHQLKTSWAYQVFLDALDAALPTYDETYCSNDES